MKKETGSYPGRFTNKTRLSKPVIRKTMQILSGRWNEIQQLANDIRACYRGVDKEDVLMDAFEHVIRDDKLRKASIEEIIESFKKEYKQLYYRAVKNSKAERKSDGVDI